MLTLWYRTTELSRTVHQWLWPTIRRGDSLGSLNKGSSDLSQNYPAVCFITWFVVRPPFLLQWVFCTLLSPVICINGIKNELTFGPWWEIYILFFFFSSENLPNWEYKTFFTFVFFFIYKLRTLKTATIKCCFKLLLDSKDIQIGKLFLEFWNDKRKWGS